MKTSSLIGHIIELLDLIRPLRQPVDNVVNEFFRARHYLGSRDRRFISETIYDILRNYRLLHFHAEDGLKKSGFAMVQVPSLFIYVSYVLKVKNEEVRTVLADVSGMLHISHPAFEPEPALNAIATSSPPQDVMTNPAKRIAFTFSMPPFIVSEWIERFGQSETGTLSESLNTSAPTTIRVNTLKTSVASCQSRLKAEGVESDRTALSPFGLVLHKRINTQALLSFKDGWFEMQDEGSQLLSLLVHPRPGQVIVDACAGGGGKTLHLAALMENEGELHAIDIDEKRLARMRPRLDRAGVTIAHLYHSERQKTILTSLQAAADAVLVDAPCSGIGTLRRNPALKLSVNEEYVERISKSQQSLLGRYSAFVKPGGRLVYSTCTLLRRENENVVEDFVATHPAFTLLTATDILQRQHVDVASDSPFLTLLPHKTGTDGFFAAVLQRA
jgi:16S rRNA (cytosine967-C5)-methyltransferase